MNQSDVLEAWVSGKKAKAGALSTDGKYLYSYALCIGVTDPGNLKVVLEGKAGTSMTTSRHIRHAKVVADYSQVIPDHGRNVCYWVCKHASFPEGMFMRYFGV
jgi:hypothetical protein